MTETDHPVSSEEAVSRSWGRLRRGIVRKRNNPAVAENEAVAAQWIEIDYNNHLAGAVAKSFSGEQP